MTRSIIRAPPSGLSTELAATAQHAEAYAEKSRALRTREGYASDWKLFSAWCAKYRLAPFPATPQTIVLYVTQMARGEAHKATAKHSRTARTPQTIRHALAAIRRHHELHGEISPTLHPLVKAAMEGIAREHISPPQKKKPTVRDVLFRMLATAKPEEKRDRAVLIFGYAGGFRESELVALNLCDITILSDEAKVYIRKSKTDQTGKGFTKRIPATPDSSVCPVQTIRELLNSRIVAGAGREDPVFVSERGPTAGQRLHKRTVGEVVKEFARRIGLDPIEYGGHSLRSGWMTQAAHEGGSLPSIMQHVGHKKAETSLGYIRDEEPIEKHIGRKVF